MSAELNPEERIVVTGMGCISPLGNDVATTWQKIIAGESGIRSAREDVLAPYPQLKVHVGAPVDNFNLRSQDFFAEVYSEKNLKRLHRCAQFALWASAEALRQAGFVSPEGNPDIDPTRFDPYKIALTIGTGIGGANELGPSRELLDGLFTGRQERVPNYTVLQVLPERVATAMSILYKTQGRIRSVVAACSTGNINIIAGAELLQLKKADIVLAGGAEAQITPEGFGIFESTGTLYRGEDPLQASRPFDVSASGFVIGEGAGIVVLETLAHARRRGAVALAELVGNSDLSDAKHETLASGEGSFATLNEARGYTGYKGKGYINAHATGTKGDAIELEAYAKVFSKENVAVSSTKSMTGHMLGATGAIEAIIGIQALCEGIIPPSIKMDNPIPETEGWNMSPQRATLQQLDYFVNHSVGFGGLNATTHWRHIE